MAPLHFTASSEVDSTLGMGIDNNKNYRYQTSGRYRTEYHIENIQNGIQFVEFKKFYGFSIFFYLF